MRRLQRDLDGKISKGVKEIEKEVMTILNIAAGKNIKKSDNFNLNEINDINDIKTGGEITKLTMNERESTGRERTGDNQDNGSPPSPEHPASATRPDLHVPGVPDEIPAEMYKVIRDILTLFTITQGDEVSLAWKDLLPDLITTYRDGMVITDTDKAVFNIQKMFYPRWWLQAVGYFNSKGNAAGILFSPNPRSSSYFPFFSSFSSFFSNSENFMYILIISVFLSLFFGYSLGHSVGGKSSFSSFTFFSRERRGYSPLGNVGNIQYQISPNFPDYVVDSRCSSRSDKTLYMTTGRSPQFDLELNT